MIDFEAKSLTSLSINTSIDEWNSTKIGWKPTWKGSYSKPLNLMIPKYLVLIYGCQEESGYICHYAFSPSWSLVKIYHVKIGFLRQHEFLG